MVFTINIFTHTRLEITLNNIHTLWVIKYYENIFKTSINLLQINISTIISSIFKEHFRIKKIYLQIDTRIVFYVVHTYFFIIILISADTIRINNG